MLENAKTSILSLFKNYSPYITEFLKKKKLLAELVKMLKLLGWKP